MNDLSVVRVGFGHEKETTHRLSRERQLDDVVRALTSIAVCSHSSTVTRLEPGFHEKCNVSNDDADASNDDDVHTASPARPKSIERECTSFVWARCPPTD
jgi:hypothetical protein